MKFFSKTTYPYRESALAFRRDAHRLHDYLTFGEDFLNEKIADAQWALRDTAEEYANVVRNYEYKKKLAELSKDIPLCLSQH